MNIEIPENLWILPTNNDKILLPGIITRYSIHRKDSTQLMEKLVDQFKRSQEIVIAVVPLNTANNNKTQKPRQMNRIIPCFENPEMDIEGKLCEYGVASRIIELSKSSLQDKRRSGHTFTITLEGIVRVKLDQIRYPLEASVSVVEDKLDPKDNELQAMILNLRKNGNDLVQALAKLQLPPSVLQQMKDMLKNTPPGQLSDLFGSMVDSSFEEKLSILTTVDLKERLQKVIELMKRQIQVLSISQELQTSIENKIGKKQREFLLREQLAAIKKELGETEDENDDEMSDIGKRVQNAKLSPDARKVANKELRRLKNMQPNMAEHQVIRTYLEWIIELPWEKSSEDSLDISKARKVLDADHQGLQKVKTRIVEYLAVRKLNKSLKGPILCLAGPPGVGKTSLGKSIANSLGRQFYRIALGGVRDEAEIRGHRRTYVGALPGLIIHAMHKCGVNNPVILLDEIDKISRDVRGDPSSALLEVLDPEQNHTFTDHYLNIPFDLSKVLFIATANDLSTIPAPLLDRMEMIEIPGYTLDEKVAIAREHLLPKQIKNHGLQPDLLQMSDAIISRISSQYTRESGVRNLEREIATVCRSQTLLYSDAMENDRLQFFKPTIDMDRLESILGQPKFTDEVSERTQTPGVVTGLAYTGNGSGGMLFIEATSVPGHGKLKLTGKLGDVIRESCEIGLTFVKANQSKLQIDFDFDKHDLHIHFPAGATPKDGPSAGVTIATAIISLLTKTPVIHHLAMTGELSLRGLVLPVGGIKEKLLAAHLGKIERVCVPEKNKKDLEDVPLRIRQDLNIILCRTIWDVLRAAFPDNQRYLQYGNLSSL